MVISLVSFGLFGPALSTTNIIIIKWRYFVIFSPIFFCSLNWEFSYSNWEKNILFGIGNTTEYRLSKRAKKTLHPIYKILINLCSCVLQPILWSHNHLKIDILAMWPTMGLVPKKKQYLGFVPLKLNTACSAIETS